MGAGSVDRTPHARAPQIGKSKRWRIRVSIPVPRRCERRTLPIELIPHTCDCFSSWAGSHPTGQETGILVESPSRRRGFTPAKGGKRWGPHRGSTGEPVKTTEGSPLTSHTEGSAMRTHLHTTLNKSRDERTVGM